MAPSWRVGEDKLRSRCLKAKLRIGQISGIPALAWPLSRVPRPVLAPARQWQLPPARSSVCLYIHCTLYIQQHNNAAPFNSICHRAILNLEWTDLIFVQICIYVIHTYICVSECMSLCVCVCVCVCAHSIARTRTMNTEHLLYHPSNCINTASYNTHSA